MTNIIGSLNGILDTQVQSGRPAEGLTLQRLAGVNRWLKGYLDGGGVPGGPLVAPTPPMNKNSEGHDHSGGMMGSGRRTTVWQTPFGWIPDATPEVLNKVAPFGYLDVPGIFAEDIFTNVQVPMSGFAYERPFIPGGRLYERLLPDSIIYVQTTACDVVVDIQTPDGTIHSKSASLALGENTVTFTNKASGWRPGRMQTFGWRIRLTRTAAAQSLVYMIWMGLHQTSDDVTG